MRTTARTLLVLLAALLPLLAGCSDGGIVTRQQGSDQGGFIPGDGAWTRIEPDRRHAAPDLSAPTLDGGTVSLDDYRGKVVVINVWGSWCAPCRKEAPDLVQAAEETTDKAQFIGLNTRDLDKAPAEAFVRAFKVPYPNLYDPRGDLLLRFTDLPPNGIPSTLIIDREGRVAARVIGTITSTTLVDIIDDTYAGH